MSCHPVSFLLAKCRLRRSVSPFSSRPHEVQLREAFRLRAGLERLPRVRQTPDFNELQNVRETPAVTPWLRYSRMGMLERFDSKE